MDGRKTVHALKKCFELIPDKEMLEFRNKLESFLGEFYKKPNKKYNYIIENRGELGKISRILRMGKTIIDKVIKEDK